MTREEVIKLLRQFIHQFDGRDVEDEFVEDVLEAAADMLEQDAKPRWISVKDKMPNEEHYGLPSGGASTVLILVLSRQISMELAAL